MIIDVGANSGEFTLEIAKRNPNKIVIAIEPIPDLCNKINEISSLENIINIKIFECAIDTVERIDYLNVAAHHDWGVSSLLEFDQSKIKDDEYWKTRTDMYFDTKIEIKVRTLESILDELLIEEPIDFIKIDAQGLDFNVLKSAGKYINLIQAGMLEVSISTTLGLYKNETYDLRSVLNWLEAHEFISYALKPNDPASNEFNLYFCKNKINHNDIEASLNLRNMSLYDGKFYWHYPLNKLLDIDLILNNLNVDLQRHIDLVHERDKRIENLNVDLQRHIDLVHERDKRIENLNLNLQRHINLVEKYELSILYRLYSKIKNLLNK